MKKTAFILMIITILSRILGFGREIALSYFFGASNISDAYLISQTIPKVIFGFIGTGLATSYIPMQSKIEREAGREAANRHTSNLLNILMLLTFVVFIFTLLFTEPITRLFATGFDGETLQMAVAFTRISLLSMFVTILTSVFSGYLQLKGNYVVPALLGFPLNFLVIASIFLSSKGNVLILAVGTVVAAVAQVVFMLPFMRRAGFMYRPVVDVKSEYIKRMLYIALPVMIGTSVNQINILVDRTIASGIAVGGISALNFANRLSQFVQGLFVASIIAVMYPMISRMAAEGSMERFKNMMVEAINIVSLFLLPATVGAMIFTEPVVRMLFGRGAFDEEAIVMTSQALFFLSIGMIGFGLREILIRGFYSLQDTKTPVKNASIGVVLNIVLNIILSRYLGIGGLSLATSISAIFTTVLLFVSLKKKIGSFGMRKISITFGKICVASSVMGAAAKLSFHFLTDGSLGQDLSLLAAIGIGAVTYFLIIYWMRIDDVEVMVQVVKGKLRGSENSR